jgi:hypothetical protein
MGTGQMSVTESKGIPPRRTSDLSPNEQSDLSPTDVWTAGVLVTFAGSSTRRPVARSCGLSAGRENKSQIDGSMSDRWVD